MSSSDQNHGDDPSSWEHRMPMGPIVITFIAVIAWLIFIVLFALDWSGRFTIFQDVIVTLVTLVIMCLVIGLGWTTWGMRYGTRRWMAHEH